MRHYRKLSCCHLVLKWHRPTFVLELTTIKKSEVIVNSVNTVKEKQTKPMPTKSPLRQFYEQEHQPISDRTWARVKKRLKIKEPIDADTREEKESQLRVYLYLAKRYPNRSIKADLVQRFTELKCFLVDKKFSRCTGREIYELVSKLQPTPSESTIYRWGEEIAIPFSKFKTYFDSEVNEWVVKIATNPKYSYDPNNLRRLQDSGQD